MAKKKPDMSVDEIVNETEVFEEAAGGFVFPDSNFGMPMTGFDFSAQASAFDGGMNSYESDDTKTEYEETDSPKKKRKKRKNKKVSKRKQSDFFYINRKLPCFMIFICLFLCVVMIGIGVLGAMPSMRKNAIVGMLIEFTSVYKKPDMTPEEDRTPTTDENGDEVAYKDKSEYVTFFDILLGTIKSVFGIGATEAEPEAAAPTDGTTEEIPTEEEGGFSMDTPFFDGIKTEAEKKGYTGGLPLMLSDYFGFAIALFLVIALYYMIKAFAALFGKRVFKHFGFASLLMLISAVVVLVGSISVLSIFVSEAGEAVDLQFGVIGDFLTAGFSSPPKFSFVLGESEEIINLPFVAGYGFYVMLALPVVTLIMSTATRKKLPYSIFD